MKWVWLLASITCEVIGTTLLKQASEESPKRCGCRTQHRDDIASLGAISRLVLRLLVPNPRKQQSRLRSVDYFTRQLGRLGSLIHTVCNVAAIGSDSIQFSRVGQPINYLDRR